jgi:TolA-binding protein
MSGFRCCGGWCAEPVPVRAVAGARLARIIAPVAVRRPSCGRRRPATTPTSGGFRRDDFRLAGFAQMRFSLSILAILSVASLAASGCEAVPADGRELLLAANQSYARGDFATGQRAASTFLHRYATSPAASEAYYLRGLCRVSTGEQDAARSDFEACVAGAQRDDLRGYAQQMLGNVAYAAGDWAAAADAYAAAIASPAGGAVSAETLFRHGRSLQRTGRWADARQVFARLIDQDPSSPRVPTAKRLFAWPEDAFAVQCGAYRQMRHADAAVERLRRQGVTVKRMFSEVDGSGLWRLLTGRYVTYDEAQRALAQVRATVPDAVIVP